MVRKNEEDSKIIPLAADRAHIQTRRLPLILPGILPGILLRAAWPVLALLGLLWFPFDWLATVWPAFGVPFRGIFQNAHDHFVGHTLFFLFVGVLLLAYLPALRRKPHWYFLGLVLAALVQETIQALFRGEAPTFADVNAFTGDAIGGTTAFLLGLAVVVFRRAVARATSDDPAPEQGLK